MKNQNGPFLVAIFSLLIVIAGLNIALLWDETMIGRSLSLLLSSVGFILTGVMLFFPSGIKWVLISKLLVLTTMSLPLVDELSRYSNAIHFGEFALPMNLALIPVSLGSIAVIYLGRASNKLI